MAWTGNSTNKVPNFIQFDKVRSDVKKSVNRAEEYVVILMSKKM